MSYQKNHLRDYSSNNPNAVTSEGRYQQHCFHESGNGPGHVSMVKVVYHLRVLTGQFTVWANDEENSGVANFLPESPRLPFAQINSIYPKTFAKA